MTNALVPATPTEATPIDEAVEIGILYRRGKEAHIEVGNRLIAKKKALKHGEWLPWLAENEEKLGFGFKHAARLMAWAKNPDLDRDRAWGKKPNSAPVRNLTKPARVPLAVVDEHLEWKWTGKKGNEVGLIEIDHECVAQAVAEVLTSAIESGYRMSKDDVRKVCELVAELWEDEEIEAA